MQPKGTTTVAKLSRPVISGGVLSRPRLAAMLRRSLAHRLLLICAGAGSGKTTVLAGLGDLNCPVAWYCLSRTDRDLPVFLSNLVASIGKQLGGFGHTPLAELAKVHRPGRDLDLILGLLVNELLDRADGHLIVALDDFQLVEQSKAVNYVVGYLLAYAPPNVHLAVASRTYPYTLSLSNLKTNGSLLSIDEAALRFTADEVEGLFASVFDVSLDPSLVATLLDQTEGWAIGLQLVGQSLRPNSSSLALQEALADSNRTLFGYFAWEVLNKQPARVQAFLLESSILPRLNAKTCNAIFGASDAERILSKLEADGTFLVRLGGEEYRYHRLFQEYLRRQLSQDRARERSLHRRAAAFFDSCGDEEGAIRHFLRAEDHATAAVLISRLSEKLFRTGRFDSLANLVSQLPLEVSNDFPDLLMWAGKALEMQGRCHEALNRYEKAESLYKDAGDSAGLSRALRCKALILQRPKCQAGIAEGLHRKALDYLGEADRQERAAALAGLAFDMICSGKMLAALDFFHKSVQLYREEADEAGEMRTLVNPGSFIFLAQGDFEEGLRLLHSAERLAAKLGDERYLGECLYGRALNQLFSGKYSEADDSARAVIEQARRLGDRDLESRGFLIWGGAADGMDPTEDSEAAARLSHAHRLAQEIGNQRISAVSLTLLANHRRRQGDWDEAVELARRACGMMEHSTDRWLCAFIQKDLGIIECGLNIGTALRTLTDVNRILADCGDKCSVARTHFWLASIYKRLGQQDEEQRHLLACLELASAHGYHWLFTDEPETAACLLMDALSWKLHADLARTLLGRMGEHGMKTIRALLSSADPGNRMEGIAVLGQMKGVNAGLCLRKLAEEGDETVRREAAKALEVILSGPAEPLYIQLLGDTGVKRGHHQVDASAWKRRNAKSLLAYLALKNGKAVHRDELIQRLWPRSDWQTAVSQLSVAVHDLRRILEPEREEVSQSRYLTCKDGRYQIVLGQGGATDAELFEKALEEVPPKESVDEAISCIEGALRIYRGDLVQDLPLEEWCLAERERLRHLYLSVLERLARLYEVIGDFDSAITCYQRVLSVDICHEESHRALINIYLSKGRNKDAIDQYRECAEALQKELGIVPEEATRLAYEAALV